MSLIILEGEPSDSNPLVTDLSGDSPPIQTTVPSEGETGAEYETVEFVGTTTRVEGVATLYDVDLTGLENDSLLLYKDSINKWVPGKKLETHTVEAGQY